MGEEHRPQHQAVEPPSYDDSPVIVLDNGAFSLKAGLAGQSAPSVSLPNCAALPFGRRVSIGASSGAPTGGAAPSSQHGAAAAGVNYVTGDDICLVPEYFCVRPFERGLLVDAGLEGLIWEKLFSKNYLNVPDTSTMSLLITEHYGTPTNVRYALTQMIFEEFGFQRLVISPAQQLIPVAFTVGQPPQPLSLVSNDSAKSPAPKKPPRRSRTTTANAWNRISCNVIGDFSLPSPPPHVEPPPVEDAARSYCQLVLDVGHQTTWALPMYGELPMEFACLRSDLGGANSSALLKNLLAYRQVNLERNELLVHRIKSEFCFTSLNYMMDLQLARKALPYPSALGMRHTTHLTQRCALPDLNAKDRSALKQLLKPPAPAPTPNYKLADEEALLFEPSVDRPPEMDLRQLMETEEDQQQWTHPEAARSTPKTEIFLGVERIRPAETLFYPADYDLVPRSDPTASAAAPTTTMALPEPHKQCGIAELVERAIFASPPVLQPLLASRILVGGGASATPNFSRRLYLELRKRLPDTWNICIYQQPEPANTAWVGGSVWSSVSGGANYKTFCITRNQYLETQ